MVGELRVAAYQALGLLPDGSGYAQTLRGFGFGGDCAVLVAADETGNDIFGTVTLEPFDRVSELAMDDTEADIRAFAVAPHAQGLGVGRKLLLAVIDRAERRGVRRLRLCTQPAMQAAQHLYAATGFSRTPELDFEPAAGLTLRAYELALPIGSLRVARGRVTVDAQNMRGFRRALKYGICLENWRRTGGTCACRTRTATGSRSNYE